MSTPTVDRVRELLNYDPDSGLFTNKTIRGSRAKAGDAAGSINSNGYVVISVDGKQHLAHRLAWLYMKGHWPVDQIDHVDGVKADNRWVNLRAATRSENQQNVGRQLNNKSGFKGVRWDKAAGKWAAQIGFNRKSFHLGLFEDPELAALSHAGAARLLFGDFIHSTTIIIINNFYDKK